MHVATVFSTDGLPGLLALTATTCPAYPSYGFQTRGGEKEGVAKVDDEDAANQKVRGILTKPQTCARLCAALRLMSQHVASLTLP